MASFSIDYFDLPTSDNGKSRDFFSTAFGWSFVSYGPTYDEVHGAGLLGGLSGDVAENTAGPLLVIRTDDLDAALAAVIAADGDITRPPFDYPGGRRFHFREPGGNELAVYRPSE